MKKFLSLLSPLIFLPLIAAQASAAPLLIAPMRGSTEVTVKNISPEEDKRVEFGITQSIIIPDRGVTHTVKAGWRDVDGVDVIGTRYQIQTKTPTQFTGTVGIDLIENNPDQINAAASLSGPLDANKNIKASVSVNTSAYLASQKAINNSYRQTGAAAGVQVKFSPDTTLQTNYSHQWITDGNQVDRVNVSIQQKLGKVVYVKPGMGWSSYSFKTKDYTSRDQFNAGVELGARFPISENLGMQIGVRPTFIQEEDKKDRFVLGGGIGLRYAPSNKTSVEAGFITTGTGINSRVRYNYSF